MYMGVSGPSLLIVYPLYDTYYSINVAGECVCTCNLLSLCTLYIYKRTHIELIRASSVAG